MGQEMLVLLQHLDAPAVAGWGDGALNRLKPQDHARVILTLADGGVLRVREFHLPGYAGGADSLRQPQAQAGKDNPAKKDKPAKKNNPPRKDSPMPDHNDY